MASVIGGNDPNTESKQPKAIEVQEAKEEPHPPHIMRNIIMFLGAILLTIVFTMICKSYHKNPTHLQLHCIDLDMTGSVIPSILPRDKSKIKKKVNLGDLDSR